MNKCFLLNPEKKFGADSSCRFREKHNFNFENSEKEWQKSFFIYSKWYAN